MYENYEINDIVDILKQAREISASPEQALEAMRVYELRHIGDRLSEIKDILKDINTSSENIEDISTKLGYIKSAIEEK
jgi:methyl-accepting chemotaxis protein